MRDDVGDCMVMETHFHDLRRIVVDTAETGERLDRMLVAHCGDLSRSRLKALIEAGRVTADGRKIGEARYRVKSGETIVLDLPPPEPAEPEGENIPLAVIYEDEQIIVIDKPAGLVVHPGAGHWTGTLVNALIAHCGESLSGIGGVKRPGIVHRLDKDTSGLLVVAKTDAAHAALSAQFAAHGRDGRLIRKYAAIVWGVTDRMRGTVRTQLGRMDANRQKIGVLRTGGRVAITHYETIARGSDDIASLIQCSLETGRTHQIRVHMAHIGHPLLGDEAYGKGFASRASRLSAPAREALAGLARQALHAETLGFHHPTRGDKLEFNSPFPEDFRALAQSLHLIHGTDPNQTPLRR
ncbi:RluA family pseudouridine synthase [Rhodoligotrophos appendicifer]|uniref:RluA family pseudouridine synthase n=1 Tax=Rhodoligotrophos appendicifer TaxID=987056 RepID=UPI003D185075